MRQAVDQLDQRADLLRRAHADAAHTGIQLEVHLCRPAQPFARRVQRQNARLVKHRLRKTTGDDRLRSLGLDAAQHENRRVDACLPQLRALLGNRHGQHGRAGLQRRARDLHRAVAVSVRLDHRQEFHAVRKAGAHHAHVVADGVKIDFTVIGSVHG